MADEHDVRTAGERIASSGLVDDVVRVRSDRDLTNRSSRRDTQATHDEQSSRGEREDRRERRSRSEDRDEREEQRPRRNRDERGDDDHGSLRDEEDEPDERDYRDEGEDLDEDDDADVSNRDDEDDRGDDGDDDTDDDRRSEELHEVTVNGKREKVTTSELRAGYMKGADYQNKTKGLAAFNRDLQEHHGRNAAALNEAFQRAHFLNNQVREMLVDRLSDDQMRQLRHENPQQWALMREDLNDRIARVDKIIAAVNQEFDNSARLTKEQQAANAKLAMSHEAERLLTYEPEWFEGQKGREPARAATAKFLDSMGFDKSEYGSLTDHRMLAIANMARKYMEQKKREERQPQPKKRQEPLPRDSRSGRGSQVQRTTKQVQNVRRGNQFRQAKAHAAKTGSTRDAAKALMHLID